MVHAIVADVVVKAPEATALITGVPAESVVNVKLPDVVSCPAEFSDSAA